MSPYWKETFATTLNDLKTFNIENMSFVENYFTILHTRWKWGSQALI